MTATMAEAVMGDISEVDWRAKRASSVQAPPSAPPLIILPGFGNDTGDYECPFGDKASAIATALRVSACLKSKRYFLQHAISEYTLWRRTGAGTCLWFRSSVVTG